MTAHVPTVAMMERRLSRRQCLRRFGGAMAVLAHLSLLGSCGDSDDEEPSGDSRPATAGASPAASDTSPTSAPAGMTDMVRFAWWSDTGPPNPFQVSVSGPGGPVLLSLLYDTLTWKDEDGIIPWLADAWEISEDGSSYTFRLGEGITWHDGRALTAADVVFSLQYYADHPYVWMPTTVVTTADVTPEGAIRVQLERPAAAFLEDIAGVVPIVPRHVWEPVADPVVFDDPARFTGSGPFTFVEHDPAQGAYRLTAHDGYWRGSPRVREWRQFVVPAEARVQVVQRGEADVSLSTDASVLELLGEDPRLEVFETAPLSIVRLAVNVDQPPLDRREVRQALAYALDRARIATTITRGPAIVAGTGVIPPGSPWYNPDVAQYDHDPETARQLLAGEAFTLTLLADPAAREPELMQPMLAAVGIELDIQRADAPTRTQLLNEGRFQLALTAHIGVGGDPDFLRRWFTGEEGNAFARGSIIRHVEFLRLAEEQAGVVDPARRRELVSRMQAILAEELPTIVLYHRRFYWVYDPAILTPMQTWGGLMNGVPFPNNKLALLAP